MEWESVRIHHPHMPRPWNPIGASSETRYRSRCRGVGRASPPGDRGTPGPVSWPLSPLVTDHALPLRTAWIRWQGMPLVEGSWGWYVTRQHRRVILRQRIPIIPGYTLREVHGGTAAVRREATARVRRLLESAACFPAGSVAPRSGAATRHRPGGRPHGHGRAR